MKGMDTFAKQNKIMFKDLIKNLPLSLSINKDDNFIQGHVGFSHHNCE